jgi:hypothetical protein
MRDYSIGPPLFVQQCAKDHGASEIQGASCVTNNPHSWIKYINLRDVANDIEKQVIQFFVDPGHKVYRIPINVLPLSRNRNVSMLLFWRWRMTGQVGSKIFRQMEKVQHAATCPERRVLHDLHLSFRVMRASGCSGCSIQASPLTIVNKVMQERHDRLGPFL